MKSAGLWTALSGLLLSLAFGCASVPKKTGFAANDRAEVFPVGTYQHSVRIDLKSTDPSSSKQTFAFEGYLQMQKESVRVTILTAMGVTALKIYENRVTEEVKTEIFVEAMKPYEPKVREYYGTLKKVLVAPLRVEGAEGLRGGFRWVTKTVDGLPEELETLEPSPGARIWFRGYDNQKIPSEVLIDAPGFTAIIKVVSYAL